MNKLLLLFSIVLFFMNGILAQTSNRYVESQFSTEQVGVDVVYGTAPALVSPYQGEKYTTNFDLKMHIFQPLGDTLSLRPVLIFAHGGGFISGEKEHDDMLAFCDTFARKGYVTATIQYRQGMSILSANSGARAVYRGLQDSRTAIRFIKEKASDYNIDTNNVYFIGSSAGAFMALHNLYMNEESERPAASYQIGPTFTFVNPDDGPDLGGLDATGNNYMHNAHPKAIVSLWGALQDTSLIKDGDPGSSVFLIHGMVDDIVPFDVGHPFNAPNLPETYGSNPVIKRASNLFFDVEGFFVASEGHEFYGVTNGMWDSGPNYYWHTIVSRVTQFLYEKHKPTARFRSVVDSNSVTFSDKSSGEIRWVWDFGDSTSSHEKNPIHEYSQNGNYRVMLSVYNEIDSWDTVSQVIEISDIATAIESEKTVIPEKFSLSQNYPNPFNPVTNIRYNLASNTQVELTVYNIIGEKVSTLVHIYQKAGSYTVKFDGTSLPSGIYFYKLNFDRKSLIKKMTLIK